MDTYEGDRLQRRTLEAFKSSLESWEKLVENSLGNHSICLATADISPTLKFLKLGLLHLKWVSFQTQKSNLGKLKQRRQTFLLFQKIGPQKKVYGLVRLFFEKLISKTVFLHLYGLYIL